MIKAVIFCLDGILITTDACHEKAWQDVAHDNGIPFDHNAYLKTKGLSRMDALNLLLKKTRPYSEGEKLALATNKNDLYMRYISDLGSECILPGALDTVRLLRETGYLTAVASSSQNARFILKQLDMWKMFDVVVDGNQVERVKPSPELFLLAAHKLGLKPHECLVVEDAMTGVEAARRSNMKVVGIGEDIRPDDVDYYAFSLDQIQLSLLLQNGTIR